MSINSSYCNISVKNWQFTWCSMNRTQNFGFCPTGLGSAVQQEKHSCSAENVSTNHNHDEGSLSLFKMGRGPIVVLLLLLFLLLSTWMIWDAPRKLVNKKTQQSQSGKINFKVAVPWFFSKVFLNFPYPSLSLGTVSRQKTFTTSPAWSLQFIHRSKLRALTAIIWLVVEPPLWKMMEFVNGKDDIPYMKWKIKKNDWKHQLVMGLISSKFQMISNIIYIIL